MNFSEIFFAERICGEIFGTYIFVSVVCLFILYVYKEYKGHDCTKADIIMTLISSLIISSLLVLLNLGSAAYLVNLVGTDYDNKTENIVKTLTESMVETSDEKEIIEMDNKLFEKVYIKDSEGNDTYILMPVED